MEMKNYLQMYNSVISLCKYIVDIANVLFHYYSFGSARNYNLIFFTTLKFYFLQ